MSTRSSWRAMLFRCENPNSDAYQYYGGRGVKVCDRWHDYRNFQEDMGPCPAGKTLDRYPNNNGNYEPGNCRWATRQEQAQNRRRMSVREDNMSGVSGIHRRRGTRQLRWAVYAQEGATKKHLYFGSDFFEACCARKSWEARNV